MGFIKYSLAKEPDKVFGLIIAGTLDEKLHYAVSNLRSGTRSVPARNASKASSRTHP